MNSHYFQSLNRYRRFIGIRKVTGLLLSIVASKLGFKPGQIARKKMLRWEFFQRLAREPSLSPLAVADHEFVVAYQDPWSRAGQVKVALRVPLGDSSDSEVFDQVFIRKDYLKVLEWFATRQGGREIQTIIDAGANIGCTALFLASRLPTGKVFCLEPEQGNYARLRLNVGLNSTQNITCFRGALATHPGKWRLSEDFTPGNDWSAQFIEDHGQGNGVDPGQTVEGIEIWGLLEKTGFQRVDFLKMDIEGAEAALLRDQRFKLFLQERVQRIAIEVHQAFMAPREAVEILESLGFKTESITEFICGLKT
jgi:FkbM family methyltransferase